MPGQPASAAGQRGPTESHWVPSGATGSHWVQLGPTRLSIPAPTAALPTPALGPRVWWLRGCHCHPWWEGASPPYPRGMAGAPPAPHSTPHQRGWPRTSPSQGAVGTPRVRPQTGARPPLPGQPSPTQGDRQPQNPEEPPPPSALPWVFRAGVPLSSPRARPGAEGRARDEQLLCVPLKGALCTPGPPAPSTTRHRRHGHHAGAHPARTSQPAPPTPPPTPLFPTAPAPTLLLHPLGVSAPNRGKSPPQKSQETALADAQLTVSSAAEPSPCLQPASRCRRARSLHREGIFLQEKYFSPGAGRLIRRKSWKQVHWLFSCSLSLP